MAKRVSSLSRWRRLCASLADSESVFSVRVPLVSIFSRSVLNSHRQCGSCCNTFSGIQTQQCSRVVQPREESLLKSSTQRVVVPRLGERNSTSVRHIHPSAKQRRRVFLYRDETEGAFARVESLRVSRLGKTLTVKIPSGRPPTLRKKQSKHKDGSHEPPAGARSAGDCGEEVGASSPRTPVPLSLFLSSASSLPRPLR